MAGMVVVIDLGGLPILRSQGVRYSLQLDNL